jgi:hypothetical protein
VVGGLTVFKKLAVSATISLSIAATYVLSRGTPIVGTSEVNPNIIEANKPSLVTVTIRIPDSEFSVYGVDLLRVDGQGDVLSEIEMSDEDGTNTDAVPGHRFFLRMRDDGTRGDPVASDRVFTRRAMLKESSGPVYFEVHASFAKVERPVRSAPFAVNVRQ